MAGRSFIAPAAPPVAPRRMPPPGGERHRFLRRRGCVI
jgi:hypothetical protein